MNIALAFRNCCNNICISTVADIPNTRKKRRVFPAISLNDIMIMFEYSIFCCWIVVYALTSILLCLYSVWVCLCMRCLCMPQYQRSCKFTEPALWLLLAQWMQDFEQNYNPSWNTSSSLSSRGSWDNTYYALLFYLIDWYDMTILRTQCSQLFFFPFTIGYKLEHLDINSHFNFHN